VMVENGNAGQRQSKQDEVDGHVARLYRRRHVEACPE
jgi:hypothetical protein